MVRENLLVVCRQVCDQGSAISREGSVHPGKLGLPPLAAFLVATFSAGAGMCFCSYRLMQACARLFPRYAEFI